MAQLSDAWETAHQNIHIAQCKQKQQHDKKSRDVKLKVRDRVMVHMSELSKEKHGNSHVRIMDHTVW